MDRSLLGWLVPAQSPCCPLGQLEMPGVGDKVMAVECPVVPSIERASDQGGRATQMCVFFTPWKVCLCRTLSSVVTMLCH